MTLTAGLTLVILGVLEGGQAWAWGSVQGVLILAVGAALLIAFVFIELHATDPVLPLWVLRRRLLLTSSLASCGIGAVVLGLSSYIPTYVQGVLGTGPVVAGFALATLTMGWPVAASQAGKVYLRIGFRLCSLIGASVVVVGAALLLLLGPSSAVVEVGAFCFVIGIGMGLSATPSLIAAQSSVGWTERGVVTGSNMFFRSMGSAVGVAVFGAIANHSLETGTLNDSIHNVYLSVLVVAAATVLRDRDDAARSSVGAAGQGRLGRCRRGRPTRPIVPTARARRARAARRRRRRRRRRAQPEVHGREPGEHRQAPRTRGSRRCRRAAKNSPRSAGAGSTDRVRIDPLIEAPSPRPPRAEPTTNTASESACSPASVTPIPTIRPTAPTRLLCESVRCRAAAKPDSVPARQTVTTISPDSKWLVMPNCAAASETSSDSVSPICAHGANSDGVARRNAPRTGAATRTRGTSEVEHAVAALLLRRGRSRSG